MLKCQKPIDYLILSNDKLLSDVMLSLMRSRLELSYWMSPLYYCRMLSLLLSWTLALLPHSSVLCLVCRILYLLQLDRHPPSWLVQHLLFWLVHRLKSLPPTSDQPDEVNCGSPVSCLPWWDVKMIEATGADVGDTSLANDRLEVRSNMPTLS